MAIAVNSAFVNDGVDSVAAAGVVDIRPASGYEAILHYVFHSGKGKVEIYDGSALVLVRSSDAGNCVSGEAIHLTNAMYARFTSTEASAAQTFSFSGVYSIIPA